jgi:hypothetical protein
MLSSRADWYVRTPAIAALMAIARSRPAILSLFNSRLRDEDRNEREAAASTLSDIARVESELLDP